MEKICILVVEDDEDINRLLCKIMEKNGYQTESAFSGSEAKLRLSLRSYDLILLDLMLPGMTGEELVAEIRRDHTMPILILSARTNVNDKIELLRLGADDYITKPFEAGEVLARVEAALRRCRKFSAGSEAVRSIHFKNLELDPDAVRVMVNGQEIPLTAREFQILHLLLSHPNRVFTRENLYLQVWNGEFYGEDNTVNVHMSNLRAKLAKADPDTEYVKTVWGIGFKAG